MKTRRLPKTMLPAVLLLFFCVEVSAASAGPPAAPAADPLPDYLIRELKRLDETWNVLDQFAGRIWPGWKSYTDVPFLFEYPNGVKMLVGHPSPTDDFNLVPGVEVRGKTVYLDRRKEIPLKMASPIIGGGGVVPFGKTKVVPTVNLKMSPVKPGETLKGEREVISSLPKEIVSSSDGQILLNIHELFHGFQNTEYTSRYGNIRINPDATIALYSEIEGLALERAYLAADPEEARRCLRDFLIARRLKRTSMTRGEANEEATDDIREGTAVFAETIVLELMKTGFKPNLSAKDDPYYFGFQNASSFLRERIEDLRRRQKDVLDVRNKCYPYGCFQALLLGRLYPGWQEGFFKSGKFLDQILREKLGFEDSGSDEQAVAALRARYPVEAIAARTGEIINKRDAALDAFLKRRGRVYMINFKPTDEFVLPKARGESYPVGLIEIYPRGIETIEIRDVVFSGSETPMIKEQLYYLKWIDSDDLSGEKDRFTLTYRRKEGTDVFFDAVFTAPGFTLKAPKIRVKTSPARIKVIVLGKIKESPAS